LDVDAAHLGHEVPGRDRAEQVAHHHEQQDQRDVDQLRQPPVRLGVVRCAATSRPRDVPRRPPGSILPMRPVVHRPVSIAGVTPAALALILLALAGVSALRWATRLAPVPTELPAKTLIATVLAVLALMGEMGWAAPSRWLTLAAVVLAPLYVFGPVVLLALVRAGRSKWAAAGLNLLYWTRLSRHALGRWLAVAALHEGDPSGALVVAPDPDDLLAAQAAL